MKRASQPPLSVVVPVFNEEENLPELLRRLADALAILGRSYEVLLVNDGSRDRSLDILREAAAADPHLVVIDFNRNYGQHAAIFAGFEAARGEIIVMADADESYDWGAIGPFVRKVQEGYDLVMGNRFKGGIREGAMPWLHRYLGNPVLSFIGRLLFRTKVGDFHCGLRGFDREAVRGLVELRDFLSSIGPEKIQSWTRSIDAVSASMISCMTGLPVTGSRPST